jgi:hypothetical protein
MVMNWDERITILIERWEKLTHGKKDLDIVVRVTYRSRVGNTYEITLFRDGRGWFTQQFDKIEDAQKWLEAQLLDMLEDEFRRQVAKQAEEEEKEE